MCRHTHTTAGAAARTSTTMTNSHADPAERAEYDVLLIRLNDEVYALSSANVREVGRYRQFTPVPGAPPTLPGIVSQRGVILPIVDLRLVLGMSAAEATRASRLVTVVHEEVEMALLVDAVIDLTAMPAATFGPVPPALDPARARFLRTVAYHNDQTVALLDVGEIVAVLRDWT